MEVKLIADNLNPEEIEKLYWEKNYNINEIAGRFNISFWKLYNFMGRHNISRRNRSEAGFLLNSLKPQFKVKENLTIAEEKLKIAGIMLYWAEGTLGGNTVDLVNSNPEMIKTFLKFLRQICGVSERRLRVYLYAYSYQDIKKIKTYWNRITEIPLSQFTKPYIKKENANLTNRKLEYGLVHIRYNDKRLLFLISSWITEFTNWAGTQVAKGGRLSKGSVLLKSMMEK